MICMILSKETNNSKEIRTELVECLLHMLTDGKTLISNSNDHFVVNEMFTRIRPCSIDQKANSSRYLLRLQKRGESVRLFSKLRSLHKIGRPNLLCRFFYELDIR